MDFSKTDTYLREHWPAVLLMAFVVIPATWGAGEYFRQLPADRLADAKIADLEESLKKVNSKVETLFTLYSRLGESGSRFTPDDIARLYTQSDTSAAIANAGEGEP